MRLRAALLPLGVIALCLPSSGGATLLAGAPERQATTTDASVSSSAPAPDAENTAPSYADPANWLAWPARDGARGLAEQVPPGVRAIAPGAARVDVFFVQPTTVFRNAVGNARVTDHGVLDDEVLRNQLSVFNGCCRLYAPRYRQASLAAQATGDQGAVALAYGDVERSFSYYLAHENHGRPFILASHSQGTTHALRLLAERIAGTPHARQLVAAYLVGNFVPANGQVAAGIPVCTTATQTGCAVSWNSAARGAHGVLGELHHGLYWDAAAGAYATIGRQPALCVNPLTWVVGGAAPAEDDAGSLPVRLGLDVGPDADAGTAAGSLPALLPGAAAAACQPDGVLAVAVPLRLNARLPELFRSYHLLDYNLFWANLRANVAARVAAFGR